MSGSTSKLTPAMRQYADFKKKLPDCVLFFRMGDFYETFYEDARICSRVCGLTLTSRSKGENPIPLAGVPYHAVEGYLKKMIDAGYKVAVCEQVEDPKTAKGPVKRDVVRVVTAGTLTDEPFLDSRRDNFLCAVNMPSDGAAAVSWVDISTGRFFVRRLSGEDVLDELLGIGPVECLTPDTRGELFRDSAAGIVKSLKQLTGTVITSRPAWYFDPYQAKRRLLKHFKTAGLEGFGLGDEDDDLIGAAGAILEYLDETQKTTLSHISSIRKVSPGKYCRIDPASLRSLEVLRTIRTEARAGSLLDSMDRTLTGMGARMFRGWLCAPLRHLAGIELRQDVVERLKDSPAGLSDLRSLISDMCDVERIAARLGTMRATPRDLAALAAALQLVPPLVKAMRAAGTQLLAELADKCDPVEDLSDLLDRAIEPDCPAVLREGGVIRNGFDTRLDELRAIAGGGRDWLAEYQAEQSQQTGIANLKVGYNKVFGYYIEVNHSQVAKVPAFYVRKQTIKNAERYITEQLKTYEDRILGAAEKATALEQHIFDDIRKQAAGCVRRLQRTAAAVAECDCLASLAQLALQRSYIRPKLTESKELNIIDGRHPVLAESLGGEFVPNDVEMGGEAGDCVIITGPNMSGKSTYIRQTALLVLMAQTGSFIPAKSATIGLVDRVFTRVGASDELTRGQSTFMVEMTETANILNNATDKSLVILDEVGRGTSTYDGLSLAWAITEFIATKLKCRTLFATHYHELTELAELFSNVRNRNVAVREWMDEVVFLHKILPGGTDKSYGIHVAKLAGVPDSILDRSREILTELETTFAKEASGRNLSRHKTKKSDEYTLFAQKHKPVLDRLASTDVNSLTPIQAINLLSEIKKQIDE